MIRNLQVIASALFLIFNFFTAFSQSINWNTAPQKGFVFQINNKEAQKLLTNSSSDTIFNGLLHTQIDTFDIKKGWVNRPNKGHFILANIVENKLHCEYTSVFPYQVFLLKEYDALSLQVLDMEGNVREDAKVKFKIKRLRIDRESKTYRIENRWFTGDHKIVTVELEGFRSVFNIEKHEVPEWNNNYNDSDGPSFYSYMITDKNKYKPNEKVRFKSYALSQSRSPLHRDLEIQLLTGTKSIPLGKVAPHRPGSFASEIHLHDSLKLTLDRFYNLQLVEKNGRIVASCKFKYEDYELDGNKLEVHLDTDKQYHPAKNKLSIIATDDNGLVLKDAKASILVRPQNIRETFQPLVILKDTLLFTEIDLSPNGATIVDIPSNLFEKTNTTYDVLVTVTNSQNQRIEKVVPATHYYSQYEIRARFSNDSIIYDLIDNGNSIKNVPMKISHNQEVTQKDVLLPYKEKLNPIMVTTNLKGELVSREISIRSLLPLLDLKGGIELDSFKIHLQNSQKLDVSWYIYKGSELLEKGFGQEMEYRTAITERTETYYVELLYSFAGEERIKRKEYEFKEDYLNVALDVPDRVYPGQEVDAIIQVTNQLGNPVNGVDLTALAVTGKLNYYLPDLPYYGNSSSPRTKRATYSKSDVNKRSAILNLDYKKWARRARLDTMKYYQFTYPTSKAFSHAYPISDSTQFAPFVMKEGASEQIYVIELNREPIYFSWTDQPEQYSFYVPTNQKFQITLRLFDRVLIFDSLSFSKGQKTILSVDLDHLPQDVRVHKIELPKPTYKYMKVYPSFTETEKSRYTNYTSSFKKVEGNAYLESAKQFIPLFSAQRYSRKESILVGPVPIGKQTFVGVNNNVKTSYQHTGGYSYAFEDNIVYKLNADKLLPEKLYSVSNKPMTTINDLVMTKTKFLEPFVQEYKWHTRVVDLIDHAIRLKVLLPEETAASGFASFVFENTVTKQIITPCQVQNGKPADYFSIPRGLHNAIVIYNNGTYIKMDSINLASHTKVVADMNLSSLHPADSNSLKWISTSSISCYGPSTSRVISIRYPKTVYGNINGTVYDENNLPLPGATIVIKGTTNGTVSDYEGRFALDADESIVTLVVSFIGFRTKELEVQFGSDLSVFMEPDIQQLQEVVVVGYGSQSRSSLSYALMGRVSGVQFSSPDIVAAVEMPDQEEEEDAERKLYRELLTLNTIRSNFSDVAFWEPKLFTNKEGQSKFRINYPDDITRWEATVYAMNRQLQTGTARKQIKSYKPIMAELNTPQFLTKGDSSFFIGKVVNYSDDKNINGKLKWSGAQTDYEKEIHFSEINVDQLPVNATSTDTLTVRYVFNRDDGYLDGEERKVPIVEQGIVRADGTLSILENREKMNVRAASNETITVEVLANQLDLYGEEVKYLLNYKYHCNEQLASKLLGLINYKFLMAYEEKPFRYHKDINKIISRLLKNQNEEFLWSWWDVSSNTSYWMSSHILQALKSALDAGYPVPLNIENIKQKAEYKFDILHQYTINDIDLLYGLASWNAQLNYSDYIKKLEAIVIQKETEMIKNKETYNFSYSLLKEKLLLQEIRQLTHLPYQRDSLLRYQKKGIMGDVRFSDNKVHNHWYNDETTVNTIAYRIIKKDSTLRNLLVPMQMYFLAQRNKGEWNTYHSSNILNSLLPDLISDGTTKNQQAIIKLSGKTSKTVDKFPYSIEVLPTEELIIQKESGLPVYLMKYKKERVTKAKTGVDGFEIKTSWSDNNKSELVAGKPITLTVEVNVINEANLEHVMIEVPIPGACSYSDKTQRDNNVETHREYFKERTVIFCENMKSGKYAFNIHLLPRFTGKYILNPAQVSLMYAPMVNANTELKAIRVK
jgi:alpha-2-macroglobulin